MKSIFNYVATTLTLIFFTACVPPQQNGGKAAPSGMSGYANLIFIGGIILVFWLFFIRPQAKKAKNQKKFIDDLQKGDKIVTIAGIHGVISKVNEDGTLHIETSPGSYLKIEKSAISMDWTAALNKPAATAADKK